MKFVEKVKTFVSEAKDEVKSFMEDEDAVKETCIWAMLPFAVTGAALTVWFWLGHPEWALSEKCNSMIAHNVWKKVSER